MIGGKEKDLEGMLMMNHRQNQGKIMIIGVKEKDLEGMLMMNYRQNQEKIMIGGKIKDREDMGLMMIMW